MAKATCEAKATKTRVHQSQTKQPSWSTMKTLFAFRNHPNVSQPPKHKHKLKDKTEDPKQKQQGEKTEHQKQKQRRGEKTEHVKQKQRQGEKTEHVKQKQKQKKDEKAVEETGKKCKKMRCSGSLCNNTKIIHRPETSLSPQPPKKTRGNSMAVSSVSASSCSRSVKAPLRDLNVNNGGVSSSPFSVTSASNASIGVGGSVRGMPFRKFYGCYECRMVFDPKNPNLRNTICSCPDCGEIFINPENLELHQAVRHAVSEVGAEDTSKNIVEIIFQSSWLKNQTPICKIDRILKVHNTQKRIRKFEDYRDLIKSKATNTLKKNPRCVADGNELLRFHCITASCALGLNGSTNLCNSIPTCHVCSIIKNGFKIHQEKDKVGILTTATSGRAHDNADAGEGKRAMLVCRVIAGRVKKFGNGDGNHSIDSGNLSCNNDNNSEYDSVAGEIGVYSNLDELYVFNPKAILPCFVVIYTL